MARGRVAPDAAIRVLMEQPERVAAAWRRERFAEAGRGKAVPQNLLEGLVEPFIVEVGRQLGGAPGSAWSRTVGVLRLSGERPNGLYEEFASLRQCLLDVLEALGGGAREFDLVAQAVEEACAAAVALGRQLRQPTAPGPNVPFGGLVVEIYERPAEERQEPLAPRHAPLH
jgi:hypothetical protein